jgi:hypothetical protein
MEAPAGWRKAKPVSFIGYGGHSYNTFGFTPQVTVSGGNASDKDHPAKLYVSDFDKNGQSECIPVYFKADGKAYPYYLKDELEQQIPSLKKKLLHYEAYAGKSIDEVFTKEQMSSATVLTVEQTNSTVFLNDGLGQFSATELPVMAQIAPIFGIAVLDINGDGINDLFMGGNFYGLKPQTGRLDAGYGTSLINNGKGQFSYKSAKETGLFIKGEARDMVTIKNQKGNNTLIVSMNNEPLYLFEKNK